MMEPRKLPFALQYHPGLLKLIRTTNTLDTTCLGLSATSLA